MDPLSGNITNFTDLGRIGNRLSVNNDPDPQRIENKESDRQSWISQPSLDVEDDWAAESEMLARTALRDPHYSECIQPVSKNEYKGSLTKEELLNLLAKVVPEDDSVKYLSSKTTEFKMQSSKTRTLFRSRKYIRIRNERIKIVSYSLFFGSIRYNLDMDISVVDINLSRVREIKDKPRNLMINLDRAVYNEEI